MKLIKYKVLLINNNIIIIVIIIVSSLIIVSSIISWIIKNKLISSKGMELNLLFDMC